jgi:Fe-S-cluster containining protein
MREKPIISTKTPREIMVELGKECRSCGHCCRFGAGYVIDEDIPRIAKHLGITEDDFRKTYLTELKRLNSKVYRLRTIKRGMRKTYGACVFFDEERKCLIHSVKPFYCTIATCGDGKGEALQWFDLNALLNFNDPESIRQWNEFIKSREPITGAKLEDLIPDPELRRKILSYEIFGEDELKSEQEKKKAKR